MSPVGGFVEDHPKKDTIKVVDRRSFTPDGKPRDPDREEIRDTDRQASMPRPEPGAEPIPGTHGPVVGEGFTMSGDPAGVTGAIPDIEDVAFVNLIVSLYQSGFIHLGYVEDPDAPGPHEPDLEGARGAIEMLAMMKRKTKGNLSAEESRVLDGLIAELQMAYAMKAPKT
jgi:hypothetical protein